MSSPSFNTHFRHGGFTLIELLVTVAVAAILLGVGIPSFSNFITKNRAAAQTNAWQSALHYARSEAMKRSGNVGMVSASDSTNWSNGWYVYVDTNGDGDYDSGEELRVFEALNSGSSLTATTKQVAFNKNGFVDDMRISQTQTWTLTQSNCFVGINRTMTLYQSGRVFVATTACP